MYLRSLCNARHLSKPSTPTTENAVAKRIQAWNQTNVNQSFGIVSHITGLAGFNSGNSYPPTTTLYFNGVGSGYNVTAQFTPFLRAYIISDYQENQILRGAIQSPSIWGRDLAELDTTTSLTLSYDPVSATYQLEEDNAALTVLRQPEGSGLVDEDLTRIIKLLKDFLGDVGTQKLLKGNGALGLIANGGSSSS
ncbi:hypothetical protein Clacol_000458 [Clathrus columnatus]|uniref:Uncharacterized protein n=1 Tax=Clathrus columnatus TaxID=1419009 RepID=A0AAV4ZYS9_9AGAM|nr:hypothetical protein Clacol_000458 [Clathrus columnatus]